MTTALLLVAAVAPLLGTLLLIRRIPADRESGPGRACVLSIGAAVLASLALLGLSAAADDGSPDGIVEFPAWFALGVDRASALLLMAVTGTGLVVASFSTRSLDAGHPRSREYFVAIAAVTTGSALVVVPGGPVPLLLGWLLAGRALVHVTGGWIETSSAQHAHDRLRRTVLVGDLALVASLAVAVAAAGPTITALSPTAIADLEASTVLGADAALISMMLLVVAGAARSALFPFHRWLTATLFAPTPVSALVHAGFVSGAGLLLLRFAPSFVPVDAAVALAIVLATSTIAIGVAASATRPDAKGGLAWSTVAQMAFMVLQVAVGAFAGAVFHIVGHGMYKAAQFLGVGDTVAAGLRARRRPATFTPMRAPARLAVTVVIATVAVAAALVVGPSGLDTDERIVLVAFAWLAVAAGVHGVLGTRATRRVAAIITASVGAIVTGIAYFVGVDLAKRFLEPSLPTADVDATAALITALVVLGVLAAATAAPLAATAAWRDTLRWWVTRSTEIRRPFDIVDSASIAAPAADTGEAVGLVGANDDERIGAAALRAQVARAASIVAPTWPLSSFVAVNPLGGLEDVAFDEAAEQARHWTRGRTHRALADFRNDHALGRISDDDLGFATHELAMAACSEPAVAVPHGAIEAADVVLTDLLHGPEVTEEVVPRTTLERRLGVDAPADLGLDDLVSEWVAAHVSPPTWTASTGGSLVATARRAARRHARRSLGTAAAEWIDGLPDDAAGVLSRSLDVCGVDPADRIEEIRGHLVSLPGWTGLARWRTDWAHPDEITPALHPIEIAAIRAMLEAAVVMSISPATSPVGDAEPPASRSADAVDRRVDAVIDQLDLPGDATTRESVTAVLAAVPEAMRRAIWLRAQERGGETRLLDQLDGSGSATTPTRAETQVVFCIDVRSEGIRRHLERLGHDETLGFAGFFGVPMSVRELGWSNPEPRCPVLVAPSAPAVEQPLVDHIGDAARTLDRAAMSGALTAAHSSTKHVPGAAFTAAETLGWIAGPRAAARTLTPRPVDAPVPAHSTTVRLGEEVGIGQRVAAAESVLRTMGLTNGFAELVVLSGHTSSTVNNAHATALECGACAGASGASNARAVASLLNESDVRTGLLDRGIEIPDDTWFVGAVHDTSTDTVTVLDRHITPATHVHAIDRLQLRLDLAGRLQCSDRAAALPGAHDHASVRRRGNDWAQVRPEWGLARNAAFVIAPRSTTAGTDLDGRAFLHSYDATNDPDGRVLEAIMTAPLVVGHWISAQYYFSTVDAETFGAGDKLIHNPVGTVGVLSGAGGDLRVGLPVQSTHVGDTAHHEPTRLLAVVQADIATVEAIIARNEVLSRLVNGSWLRIAARSGPDQPWATRSPGGTWSQLPREHEVGGHDDVAASSEHHDEVAEADDQQFEMT